MKEIWKVYKTVEWYNKGHLCRNIYEISNLGNVKQNDKLIDCSKQESYYRVGHFYIHRMVAEIFIPNFENKQEVDHIDGNKHNNRVDNLRWVTHKENNNNPITKNRHREKLKDYFLNHDNPFKGKSHSEETNKYNSEWHKTHKCVVFPDGKKHYIKI